jgi:hypothetical protein
MLMTVDSTVEFSVQICTCAGYPMAKKKQWVINETRYWHHIPRLTTIRIHTTTKTTTTIKTSTIIIITTSSTTTIRKTTTSSTTNNITFRAQFSQKVISIIAFKCHCFWHEDCFHEHQKGDQIKHWDDLLHCRLLLFDA